MQSRAELDSNVARERDATCNSQKKNGGRGGIRTHGGFPHDRFRVECLKPDSATLPLRKKERRTSSVQRKYHTDDPVWHGWISRGRFPREPCWRWQTEFSASRGQKM